MRKEDTSSYTIIEQLKHMSWCIKNNIIIHYELITYNTGKIIINDNNIITVGEHIYKSDLKKLKTNDENWSKIILELYTEKYLTINKNKKNENIR